MATIADLLMEQGRQMAETRRRQGEIQAQKWQSLASIIAQTGQAVGQQIQNAPLHQAEVARVQQQNAAAALNLSEAKRGVAARTALGQAVAETPHVNEDGVSLYDIPTISSKLEQAGFADHVGDVASQLKGLNDSFRAEQQAKLATVQRGAQALLQTNGDPELTLHFIDMLEKNHSWKPEDLQQFRDIIQRDPSKTPLILRQFAGPSKVAMGAPGSTPVDEVTGQPVGPTLPNPQKTEAELAADAANPNSPTQAQSGAALKMLKPDVNKPGTVEDWVGRARRLAVAQNGGQPLTDAQQQQVDASALQAFKQTNADPEVRAATLAQKNLALALGQMQQSQQPTPEQAHDVAADVIAHRLAPEQLSSMFGGFGAAGQAFKRLVYTEAKKLDPEFNFEQAAAEYGLAKSPAFQQTVRYMDAATESIPRLEQTAAKLGNGKFRTLNDIANAGKNQFNSTDLKAFKTDALLVGDEIAKILQGGGTGSGTSDAKLKQAQDLISTSDNVPSIAAAVNEVKFLIGNRRKALTRGTYLENQTPAPTSTAPTATHRFNPATGKVEAVAP